ncbi:MAG: hypothetical protein IJZ55_05505 [Lachnospiraceae bacterium]|nr:hypothetical protein [Lachnospiraceae bacterium]
MKKLFSIGMLCVMLLGLVGCVDKETQETVKEYINTTSVYLMEQEQKMIESYSSVIGANFTDDSTLCMEFALNTIPMAENLKSAAEGISETITAEELLEVHNIYVSYISEFSEALNLFLTAVDEQDKTISAQANEKLSNANVLAAEFRTGLQRLAEKYEITSESK